MDPNENLTELLRYAKQFTDCPEKDDRSEENHDGCRCPENMERAGELIVALDGWIRRGGFLPDAWDEGLHARMLRRDLRENRT